MNPRSVVLRAVALAVTGSLLAACGGDDGPETTDEGLTVATIGVLPIIETAPVYLGIEKGFYEDEGIELQPELAAGGADVVPAVVSEQYEFGFSNVVSLLLATDEDLPLTMVAAASRTTGEVGDDLSAVVVNGDSPIQSPADLEGATVSVNTRQNIGDITIRAAMRAHGADGSAIEFTELPFPEMPAQLDQGRIDAAWVVEPFVSAVLGAGGRAILWNFAETDPNLIIAGYFTNEQLRNENPDLVQGFVNATTRAMEYAAEHPDETREIITTYTELSTEQAQGVVLPRFDPAMDRDVLTHTAELMQEFGLTEEVADVEALVGEQ